MMNSVSIGIEKKECIYNAVALRYNRKHPLFTYTTFLVSTQAFTCICDAHKTDKVVYKEENVIVDNNNPGKLVRVACLFKINYGIQSW